MNKAAWGYIKATLYYEDGSLRDILINDVDFKDWKTYLEHLNNSYKVSWHSTSGETKDINMEEVFRFLESDVDGYYMVVITIGDFSIDCHLGGDVIEHVLSPRDIKSIDDHNMLLKYIKSISNLLSKPIVITSDNTPEDVLMSVYDGIVVIK
jgi:hypothetical protein